MKIRHVILSLVALCLLASCETVSTGKLLGIWPTCWEPGNVEKASAAADRLDWATLRTFRCSLFGDLGTPVRVIRCAADVTPARMNYHFDPVRSDDSLPDEICEVETFDNDGSSGIYYTHFLNIRRKLP